ncbi:MAG TPA: zinc/iron-chelating domain-containing protein [Verrucomicrobia bacterium]|nr:zinc/iron-chelating domain-containing protein [Verrucomicrobiota bacterium]
MPASLTTRIVQPERPGNGDASDKASSGTPSGFAFKCRCCGACCRIPDGIVRVSDAEIARIAAFLGKSEAAFIAEDTVLAPDRRGLVLSSRPDGACVWLTAENLCRINPVKPDKCRTFPHAWTNPDSGTVCPVLAARQ